MAKLFVAAFAVGVAGLGFVIEKSVKAATENQQAFATLSKAVTNVGAAHDVAGKSIQSVIDKQAQLKGFSTTDLAQGFTELVDDTHNTAKAFKLLQVSEDAARVAHESDATAAAAVGKAYEGSTNALRQFGIVVTPVKTAVEALADSHQKASIALETEATQQDKVLTGQEAIADSRRVSVARRVSMRRRRLGSGTSSRCPSPTWRSNWGTSCSPSSMMWRSGSSGWRRTSPTPPGRNRTYAMSAKT